MGVFKRIARLCIVVISCITLYGCTLTPSAIISTNPIQPNPGTQKYIDPDYFDNSATREFVLPALPNCEFINISDCFVPSNIEFDPSQEILSLICANLVENEHATASEIVSIRADKSQKMILRCTWAPCSRNIYVCFQCVDSNDMYLTVFSDGAAAGILDLSVVPDGEYKIIMFSNNNPAITAVLNYQIGHSNSPPILSPMS